MFNVTEKQEWCFEMPVTARFTICKHDLSLSWKELHT